MVGILNDSLKNKLSIERGSILSHINDIPIVSLFEKYQSKNSHSRVEIARSSFSRHIPFYTDDVVTFTFDNSKVIESKMIVFEKINLDVYYKNIVSHKEIGNDIGYINTSYLSFFEFGKIMRKYRKKKYLIFDCRGYASFAVLRYGKLLRGQTNQVTSYYYPNYKKPGYFTKGEDNYYMGVVGVFLEMLGILPKNRKGIMPSFRKPYKGEAAILINDRAQSFGETSIMTLQAYLEKDTLIGSKTTGANGNVSYAKLVGGIEVGFTGIDFRYANGTILQKAGIIPDIEILPDLASFKKEEDKVLLYAIDYLKK